MLTGKYLSLPVGLADYEAKVSEWMHWDEFLTAETAGFKPAVEWKGKPPTPEIVEYLSGYGIFWGIHAPNNFADTAYNNWDNYSERMEEIASLWPAYIVVHGGLDTLIDVSAIPLEDPVERYRSPIGASEYLLACQFQHKLLLDMASRAKESRILVENTGITEFVGGCKLPTYTHPRVGNWIEVKEIASNAGVGCLCDVGHLSYSRNFFRRQEDYGGLPQARGFGPVSEAETIIWNQLGLGIRKGEFPVVHDLLDLPEAIETIGANYFHLDPGYREDLGGRIGSHGPIELDDQRIRGIIAQILRQENCLMCLEVDGSRADGSGPFPDRQPTEVLQASSWRNLCTISTELVS